MQLSNRRREMGGSLEEPFDGFLIRGKFTDGSTEAAWHCKIDNVDVDLTPFVNPDTKEFEYRQEKKPKNLYQILARNPYITAVEIIGMEEVTNMAEMFHTCTALTSVVLGSNDKVVNFTNMIYSCSSLKEIDLSMLDTKTVVNWSGMFAACYGFRKLIANFDFTSATNVNNMFPNSSALSDVIGEFSNIKIPPYTRGLPLTNESAMVFINGLAEVETPQTITFSAATYAKLTPEQIAIAESKNWIVSHV